MAGEKLLCVLLLRQVHDSGVPHTAGSRPVPDSITLISMTKETGTDAVVGGINVLLMVSYIRSHMHF